MIRKTLLIKKKILIIGAGIEQVDLILSAKKLGLFTIVTDAKTNAPGRRFADIFYKIDTRDIFGNLKIAIKHKIHAVTSICSETAVPTTNQVAEKLNLPSLEEFTVKNATNKFFMKKNFKRNKIKTSNFFLIKNFEELKKKINNIKFPFVMKPLNSFGQKNIYKVDDFISLKKKYMVTSNNQKEKILIEKYINGQELNCVAIFENFKCKVLSISDRNVYLGKESFGIAHEHIYPSRNLNKKKFEDLKKLINKIGKSLRLKNGVLYPQIIKDQKLNYYVVEVAVRIPGGCMSDLSMLASGVDLIKFEILRSLGEKKLFKKSILKQTKAKKILVHFFTKYNVNNQSIINYNILKKLKKSKYIYKLTIPKLKKIPRVIDSSSRFGHIILKSHENIDLRNKLKLLLNKFLIKKKLTSQIKEFTNTYFNGKKHTLKTERLSLIPLNIKNHKILFNLRKKMLEEKTKIIFFRSNISNIKQHLKWFDNYKNENRIDYLIYNIKKKIYIGSIHLKFKENYIEMGKFIPYLKFRRQGFMFEAASKLLNAYEIFTKSNKLLIVTSKDNKANIEINKKLGFKFEKNNNKNKLWQKMYYQSR